MCGLSDAQTFLNFLLPVRAMSLKFFNTLTRMKEEFKPINAGKALVYCCGPTVYDFAHIGNLRTYIFEDILRRTLEYNGFKVKLVLNITDVGHRTSDADVGEDKLVRGIKREGLPLTAESLLVIARKYTEAVRRDM